MSFESFTFIILHVCNHEAFKILVSIITEWFHIFQNSDEETSSENNKVSLTEFRKQYHELTSWLAQVLQTIQKSTGSLMLSEKYLVQVGTVGLV